MLKLDYANCLADRVGAEHGIDPERLAPDGPLAKAIEAHTASLESTRGTDWERWRLLAEPGGNGTRDKHVSAVKAIVEKHKGRWENLVVLGIGGSALGNIALQSALNPSTYNLLPAGDRAGPRLFVIDNVDPDNFAAVMKVCDPKKTLFNVISKSGETAETAAQFMIIRDLLAKALGDNAPEHIVAITDEKKGTMRTICDAAGYVTLPVPDGVGGRFSALSPVGLFSAAMCGIDIDALLDGANAMEARCRKPELHQNPAAMLATLLVELGNGTYGDGVEAKPNHVLMPYANSLYLLADWYRQLWAESLGKRVDTSGKEVFAGFTPIKALGATDQHSQVQLYREGPNDKVFGFIEVERFDADVTIPKGLGVDALTYLEGQPMAKLLNAEKRATEYALVESKRPNFTLKMPAIDAEHVGEFMMLWEVTTAYAGLMLGIDAYDQPAVETGKKATFGLMGRDGYGEWLQKVDATLVASGREV
ncbi:MAG: glucose-6-phosphate isomerase [Phycisphaerae bacterium]|nr:glucose-6-phosphate isomerase [Phycisphaerae bacterium]